jgi:acyl-coenzyme A thioesterase PaaI-like protein
MGRDEHQGYPGRMHGGLITALLDETIGRAVMIEDPDALGVTAELSVRFRHPVPLEEELRIVGRIDKSGGKVFSGSGELILSDGTVAASAVGKYIRLSIDSIVEDDRSFREEWFLEESSDDPKEI